jgi:hypothetical protein
MILSGFSRYHSFVTITTSNRIISRDYFCGIMFLDVLTECPQVWYVRLPVKTHIGDREDRQTSTRFFPMFSQSVGIADGGSAIKYVKVITVFVSLSREPVSSSFTINVWKLRQDDLPCFLHL